MARAKVKPERRAWDSDALIAYLAKEEGRVDLCDSVIAMCEAGKVELVVSTLATAEVVKLRHHPPISAPERKMLTDFFDRSFIVQVAVTPRHAEVSRALVWNCGIDPKDGIHVATALLAKVPVLETFDHQLHGQSGLVFEDLGPLEIRQPKPGDVQLSLT